MSVGAEFVDIEDEIKQEPKTEEYLDKINATYKTPINMETITHNLPRLQVAELWKLALARCVRKLRDSKKHVRILSGHLVYYSTKRSEFYSVADFSPLLQDTTHALKIRINKVLLLIDDVYDMYMRLPELYSPSQIEPLMERMNVDITKASKETMSRVTMSWQTRNLLHLLSWRNVEPIIAENLARQLNAEFLIWPAKQLIKAIKLWLTAPSQAVYLYHPIGDPRRQRNSTGAWSSFIKEINNLQDTFAKHSITLAAPTGIDEYRFEEGKSHGGELPHYTGNLTERWPLISGSSTLYTRPDAVKDPQYLKLMKVRYWDPNARELKELSGNYSQVLKDEIRSNCQVLITEIESQISSRDFLFVYNTKGLLVYRPYHSKEAKASFSGGVDAEVRLWEDIVQLGLTRRIAFVHFEPDVKLMLTAKTGINEEFVDQIWTLLKIWKVPRDMVKGMVSNRGNVKEVEDILNRSNLAQADKAKLEREFHDNWETAKVELLRKYLSNGVQVDDRNVGIWLVKNSKSFQLESLNVAHFLRNGTPRVNNWESTAGSLIDDKLVKSQVSGR